MGDWNETVQSMFAKERSMTAPENTSAPADERKLVDQAWEDLVEKDDRTSPEDYPDMALITRDELAAYMDFAARSDQGAAEAVEEALRNERWELEQAKMQSRHQDARKHSYAIALLAALSPREAIPARPEADDKRVRREAMEDGARLDWLEANPRASVSHVGGWDEADEMRWAVHVESGNRNDREWDEIGSGQTVREALDRALLRKGGAA